MPVPRCFGKSNVKSPDAEKAGKVEKAGKTEKAESRMETKATLERECNSELSNEGEKTPSEAQDILDAIDHYINSNMLSSPLLFNEARANKEVMTCLELYAKHYEEAGDRKAKKKLDSLMKSIRPSRKGFEPKFIRRTFAGGNVSHLQGVVLNAPNPRGDHLAEGTEGTKA